MTHYISAFNPTGRTAVCGVEVPEGDHSVEPTCPACAGYLSREPEQDEDTPETPLCGYCSRPYTPRAFYDPYCSNECGALAANDGGDL